MFERMRCVGGKKNNHNHKKDQKQKIDKDVGYDNGCSKFSPERESELQKH